MTEFAGLGLPKDGATQVAKESKDSLIKGSTDSGLEFKNTLDSKQSQVRDRDNLQNEKKPAMNSGSENLGRARTEKSTPSEKAVSSTNTNKTDSQNETKTAAEKETKAGKSDVKIRGVKAQLNPKQKAMLKFMDSMESEFSIPPQQIVAAMANLTDQELTQPPEETAQTIIAQLGLSPEDQEEAQEMYLSMLQDLSSLQPKAFAVPPLMASLQAETPAYTQTMIPGELPANTAFMSHKEQRMLLNKNLDRMNDQFFMSQNTSLQAAEEMPVNALNESMTTDSMRPDVLTPPDLNQLDVAKLQTQIPPGSIPMENLEQMANREMTPAQQHQLMKSLATLSAAAAAIGNEIKQDPANQTVNQMAAKLDLHGASMMNGGMGVDAVGMNDFNAKNSNFDSNNKSDDFFPEPQTGNPHASQMSPHLSAKGAEQFSLNSDQLAATAAGSAGIAQNAASQTGEVQDKNVQSILNQAQYMIKKGGGEARVQMTPEGMGKVDLRVVMSEGKVNLEMTTENKEAKKLLESNMSDLKTELASQKIHLDTVKIDVNTSLSSDSKNNHSQNNSDSASQQPKQNLDSQRENSQREQARQFMQNFRDENSARRDQGYEMPGLRDRTSPYKRPDPLTPVEASSKAQRYASQGKGSGLDLVA